MHAMATMPEFSVARDSRVAIILPTLLGGGAERVATGLANHWSAHERNVGLITIDELDQERYPLDQRVRRVGLGLLRDSQSLAASVWNNQLRVRRLRKAVRDFQPKVVVSFTDVLNVTTLLACRGLDAEVIVCERTDPRRHRLGRIWTTLRERTYRRARAIVVQTNAVAAWAAQRWNRPIYVIPNAAPAVRDEPTPVRSGVSPRVIAVGRLSPEKGFDLLIAAFAQIAAKHPDWLLHIFGEGPEQSNLMIQIRQLDLQQRASLPGWISDVESALRCANVFVLPSRYEGFPNALLEAMATGLACISFDCDSGPREIIRDAIDGVLARAEDVGDLARKLDQLMGDAELRRRLGKKAREVTRRFSRDLFYRRWDAVLEGVSPEVFAKLV